MRVGLCARVSTMHNQNPEMQLAELREHATRRGWEVVSEYIDRGITGARERRPELDRLWQIAASVGWTRFSFIATTDLPGASGSL
jgi:DNA invertase Pin-like site-specific DNA recombinase